MGVGEIFSVIHLWCMTETISPYTLMVYDRDISIILTRCNKQHIEGQGEMYTLGRAFLLLPATTLTGSSCLFVALIVFLRLLTIKSPMTYARTHAKLGHIGSRTIWSFSFIVNLVPVIGSLPSVSEPKLRYICRAIAIHASLSAPILLTLIMYGILLYTLKHKHSTSDETSRKMHSLRKMIRGVIAAMIICNAPMIVWGEWAGAWARQGRAAFQEQVFNTNM